MTIKIKFDAAHNPELPTLVLAKRNGDKLGKIDAKSIEVLDSLNAADEVTFCVYKYIDGKKDPLWDQIVDFKLVYCVEWDKWFEIRIELDKSTETVKTVFCTSLGQAELSQIMLYTIEINTEDDIARDDYVVPTVLYDEKNPKASLLHRIMEKAPHYKVIHVDHTIAGIQRTFSFDDTSIYDAMQDISEEIHCLFVFHSNSDNNGNIQRIISVYDLESNCIECGHRGEYTIVCPECGSENINEGYGEDTLIFVTSDELAEEIKLTTDTESVKNCFKLEAGDDLMTATIRNCNPNGTDYIWYISDAVKEDMSDELVDKIKSYDELYSYYQKDHIVELDSSVLSDYNALVEKYLEFNEELEKIESPIQGYPSLMNAYYNAIDFELYLQSAMMPDAKLADTSAILEAEKLTEENLSPVSATSIDNISLATADNTVLAMAKVVVDSRYKIKVESSSLEDKGGYRLWTGSFTLTNYSDEEDVATSATVSIVVNDDYEHYVQQKLERSLVKGDVEDLSISGLFAKSYDDFVLEIKKYSLNRLTSFHDACQACIDILIDQGIADQATWADEAESGNSDLYENLYLPYLQKLSAIESEMKIRQEEIDLIVGIYSEDGDLKTHGLQSYIENAKSDIQDSLDFEEYLGSSLWLEFCAFRREDKYSNDNFISDGLNNAELFSKANEFIKVAQNEIYKSAELQHSISSSLRNLLLIEKFAPLVNDFKVGNWLRVMVDDKVYKLRLIEYSIDYDDIGSISVEFSDAIRVKNSVSDVREIISQASSMATSYSSVKRQAQQGEKSNSVINNWFDVGLDATNIKITGGVDGQSQTWDSHGMLFREYDDTTGTYLPEQMKIINSTIAITDDDWKSTKTAVGKYYYTDLETGELKMAYGINAETIIGKLVIGENLAFSNSSSNMTFDNNGLVVKNDVNVVSINPNDESIFNIKSNDSNILNFDEDGNLVIVGNIYPINSIESEKVTGLADVALSGSYNDLKDKPNLNLADVATSGSYNDLIDKPNLSTVATSGSYNDLSNKPSFNNVAYSGNYTDLAGNVSDAGKLLYVDSDGSVISISISDLKTLLEA